VHYSLK